MDNSNKDFITHIEQGKFKNKNLFYVLRGFDVLNNIIHYGSSFLVPLVTYAATTGNIPLVVLSASGLFSRGLINSTITFFKQKVEQKYYTERNKHTAEHKLKLLEKAKNIVTEEIELNNGTIKKERNLQPSEINSKLGDYIGSYLSKKDGIFNIYCNAVASILSIGGVCATSIATGANPIQTLGLLTAGIGIGVGNIWYSNKKRKKLNQEITKLNSKSALIRDEIIKKDSITHDDHEYKISKMKDITEKRTKTYEKLDLLSVSTNFINNLAFATLIATMSFGNFDFAGGINASSVAQLVTMIYFYTDIGMKVHGGLSSLNKYVSLNDKYQTNLEIAKDIVNQVETRKDLLKTVDKDFSRLEIKDFNGTFYIPTKNMDNAQDFAKCSLNIPNFSVEKGKPVLITGKSGSGKTTLFKWLKNGDVNNQKGMTLDDQEKIDYLGDSAILYATSMELSNDETVLKEITLGKNLETLSPEERNRLLTICRGLCLDRRDINDPFSNRNYLKELDNKCFGEFSQGQKQRLALAKILYQLDSKHQVLIFDEPTANLDKETSREVFKFISEFSNKDQKRIVILSSHETEIASKFVDKTYEIADGVLQEKAQVKSNNRSQEFSKDTYSNEIRKKEQLEFDER